MALQSSPPSPKWCRDTCQHYHYIIIITYSTKGPDFRFTYLATRRKVPLEFKLYSFPRTQSRDCTVWPSYEAPYTKEETAIRFIQYYFIISLCFQWFGVLFVLLYRLAIAIFCTGGIIASGVYYPDTSEKWFIYLSNWTFLFVTLYFICATIVTAIHYKKRCEQQENEWNSVASQRDFRSANASTHDEARDHLVANPLCDDEEMLLAGDAPEASQSTPMSWFQKTLWVIYDIASVAAILVTISFWSLIYKTLNNQISVITIIIHAVNSFIIVADTMLSSVPVRLLHIVYPMLYTTTYALFTVLYWAYGGTSPSGTRYIYPVTDYTGRPVYSAVAQLCLFFIGLPLCQCLVFSIYCLRVWIQNNYAK